ncbi:AMP-binding enzyme domain-containing protein [Ditylenchus destructor]|uniref:long-chain-fatty-acid--CoA ligase n=1 Tax=Ditylenchus destructor TaxID=166010 RepID=A0AAD4MZ39_9BILA|nr:AMP-binding enzyme domain-containing protein [Ditylenchus destructor]
MVIGKESPLWVTVPINFGGSAQGSSAVPVPSLNIYSVGAAATLGAMGLGWYMWSQRPITGKIVPLVDPNMQTRQLPDGSRVCKYLKSDALMRCRYADATTLFEAVRRGARVSKNGPMLGYRVKQEDGSEPYVWMHYNEVIDRSVNLGRALRQLGQSVGQGTFIGVYSRNRPEWIITEHATYAFNNVLVPLYETLGADSCVFIINQANIEVVFCDSVEKAKGLLEKKSECGCLQTIVLMGCEPTEELKSKAEEEQVNVYTFAEVEQMGTIEDVATLKPMPPTPEDLSTICYTSGTTGTPKGVMLTHGNVIADCTTLDYFKNTKLTHQDVMMSFLPLAHMFERVVQAAFYTEGGSVGFFRGDIRGLADDIKTLRPTVLPVVPRVLNRLYDKVLSEVNKSQIKKMVFDAAVTIEGDFIPGHVGVPSPCNAIKLVDVPELGYFSRNQAGEVCIKGTNVFKGYYKMEEQTRETLDTDGWLHTGDIGRWTERGTLKIVDRKKHIFKLSQGEYVAPEKIENVYMRSNYVAQCFVHGVSLKTCLIAVIVPDPEVVPGAVAAEFEDLAGKSMAEMCADSRVKQWILDDIVAVGKKAGLFSFEQVKDIYLCPELFSVENDLLTPTLKSKRPKLKEYFAQQIDEMYSKLD